MKQKIVIIFLLIFSLSVNGQKLNFEALDKYFLITDSLKQNIPLSQESWKNLLSSAGIQLYIKNNSLDESTLEMYRKNLEYVYMPKYDSLLKARLMNREKYFILWIFNNYKTQELELKNYFHKIKANQSDYMDSLYKNCYSILPKRMWKKATNTTIYFIPLMNDAVAEEADVVFTLYCVYHFDKLKFGALGGHEIHHVLRQNKSIANTKDKFLYEALTLLLNEGSADLIDKKYTALKDCPEDLAYYDYLMDVGKSILPILDTSMINHSRNLKLITKSDLQNIAPMSGHIPGCYMAYIINRNGLKDELINSIDNPVKFIMLYNKAASLDKDKPYIFSTTSIAYLKKIKQQNSLK
ncbi:MAG: hypothetical protein C0446_04865 [Chitinophaga sp.]|nr:hypothetical protein [Chitinophaga sp.]